MNVSRIALASRGVALTVALAVAAAAIVAGSAGVFSSVPTVTVLLPASAGPVKPDTPVRYEGVTVGEVSSVQADFHGARLTVRMNDGKLPRVPAGVRARLLPRTIFGDEYIALSVPDSSSVTGVLRAGAVVQANTSTQTVRLYSAYNHLYKLISAMHPAEIQLALDTVAGVLDGRGAEIGRLLDKAARLGKRIRPMLDDVGADLRAVAELARGLASAAPDMLAALEDAVALSGTVVSERDTLRRLLTSGTALAAQARRSLIANGDRIVQLAHATNGIAEVLGRYPAAITGSLDAAGRFLEAAGRAFSTGRFKISAALTLDNSYPYTAADCPRYPGNPGPNCDEARSGHARPSRQQGRAPRGTVGPVGSPGEEAKLRERSGLLPNSDKPAEPDADLLGLLLGPLVRGGG